MASEGLIPLLKRVALEAVDASKPTVVLYGTVSGITPNHLSRAKTYYNKGIFGDYG